MAYVMICDFCDQKIDEYDQIALSVPTALMPTEETIERVNSEFQFCSWQCLLAAVSAYMANTATTSTAAAALKEAEDLYAGWAERQEDRGPLPLAPTEMTVPTVPSLKLKRSAPVEPSPTGAHGGIQLGTNENFVQPTIEVEVEGVTRRS